MNSSTGSQLTAYRQDLDLIVQIMHQQNTTQQGNNPRPSKRDTIIFWLTLFSTTAEFFGISGKDVTDWLINGLVWLILQISWFAYDFWQWIQYAF